MGFTSLSKPVQPSTAIYTPQWVEPMNLELYSKVLEQKNQIAQSNIDFTNTAANELFSVNAEGPDKKRLIEIYDEFKNNLNSLNMSDLSSMETSSRLRGLIGKYSTDKDLISIKSRAAFREQEEKKMQKAQEKGRSYNNKNYNKLLQYYQGQDYYQDPKGFTLSSGYLTPEIKKIQDGITKANTRQVAELGPDGRVRTYNKVDGDKAQQQWAYTVTNDPELMRYYSDRFEDQYEGVDFDTEGKKVLTERLYTLQQLIENSEGVEREEYESKARRIEKAINSNYTGSIYRNLAFQEFIDDDANDYGNSINALDLKDLKADQLYLADKKYAQEKEIARFKEQLKRDTKKKEQEEKLKNYSLIDTKIKDEMRKWALKKAVELNIDIMDPSKDANSADPFISNEVLFSLGLGKKQKEEEEESKGKEEKGILLGGAMVPKKTIIASLDANFSNLGGDGKTNLKLLLDDQISKAGLTQRDPAAFGIGEDFEFVNENGVKYIQYEADEYFGDTNYRVPVEELKKAVDDPTYIPSFYNEDDDYKKPVNKVEYEIDGQTALIPKNEEEQFLEKYPNAVKK